MYLLQVHTFLQALPRKVGFLCFGLLQCWCHTNCITSKIVPTFLYSSRSPSAILEMQTFIAKDLGVCTYADSICASLSGGGASSS
jgi:hypothetical protein